MLPTSTMRIVVAPVSKGRYSASLGERLLLASARCPLLESARLLLAEGVGSRKHAGDATPG
jgi:hypothetical protein